MHVHDSDVGTVRNKAAKKEKKEIVSIVDMDLHVKNWVITKPQNTKHSAVQVRTTDQWISWLPKSVLVSGRCAWSTIWELRCAWSTIWEMRPSSSARTGFRV